MNRHTSGMVPDILLLTTSNMRRFGRAQQSEGREPYSWLRSAEKDRSIVMPDRGGIVPASLLMPKSSSLKLTRLGSHVSSGPVTA